MRWLFCARPSILCAKFCWGALVVGCRGGSYMAYGFLPYFICFRSNCLASPSSSTTIIWLANHSLAIARQRGCVSSPSLVSPPPLLLQQVQQPTSKREARKRFIIASYYTIIAILICTQHGQPRHSHGTGACGKRHSYIYICFFFSSPSLLSVLHVPCLFLLPLKKLKYLG